jgi:hypothetical protein
MPIERCAQCGFDSDAWSDASAMEAIVQLPARWMAAVSGLSTEELRRRPVSDMWSIAEYTDHVREVLFGMRLVLDTATESPGTDLGDPPEAPFDPEPRPIDVPVALSGIEHEARELYGRLTDVPSASWEAVVLVGGEEIDLHWIARHAVHDATHHLDDVVRLRIRL